MNTLQITHIHGREMYVIGLEYALAMLDVMQDIDDLKAHLQQKIKQEKQEISIENTTN